MGSSITEIIFNMQKKLILTQEKIIYLNNERPTGACKHFKFRNHKHIQKCKKDF